MNMLRHNESKTGDETCEERCNGDVQQPKRSFENDTRRDGALSHNLRPALTGRFAVGGTIKLLYRPPMTVPEPEAQLICV